MKIENLEHLYSDDVCYSVELDNCEYLILKNVNKALVSLTHKGNCKYCLERQKEMIQQTVEQVLTSCNISIPKPKTQEEKMEEMMNLLKELNSTRDLTPGGIA